MSTPGQVGSNATELKSGAVAKDNSGHYYRNVRLSETNSASLFTLDALEAMARAVSGYPGRKNLIWLSGQLSDSTGT